MSNIPKLRFSEFGGEWEEKKLGEIFYFLRGSSLSKSDIAEDGINKCIHYGELFTIYKEKIAQIKSSTNLTNGQFSKIGDILMPSSDVTSQGLATASAIFEENVIVGGDTNILRPKKAIDSLFVSYFLNSNKNEIMKAVTGTTVKHIYNKDVAKLKIYMPIEIKEQTKIASFLSAVDTKIEQLTKKEKLLQQYKKGVMQKIFSQEIRFKADDGSEFPDWEEKKLGEVGKFQTSSIDKLTKDNEKEVFLVNYMNVYRHENIDNHTIKDFQIVTAKDSQIESCNLKKGDILFTPSSETPDDIGHSVVIFEDLEDAVFSYHLMRFRPNIEINILYSHYFCNIPSVLNQLSKFATGSTRFTISVKYFSSVTIQLPCLKEQTKIANFLLSIDKKIELISKEIEKAKEFKKGLLQQMFV